MTTPHFEIRPLDAVLPPGARAIALTGTRLARNRTFTRGRAVKRLGLDDNEDEDGDEDNVSWTSLLASLHDLQQDQVLKASQKFAAWAYAPGHGFINEADESHLIRTGTAIVFAKPKARSWDLMPPDVVRPLASTTLGTLIAIAHRMGMTWVDLVPRDGKIRAEGKGHSISANVMRGMGIVVEYNMDPGLQQRKRDWESLSSLYVPSIAADKVRHQRISQAVM